MPKVRLPRPDQLKGGVIFSVLLVLLLFVLLGRSYLEVKSKMQRLRRLETEVEEFRDKKKEFEADLAYRQSEAYIEKEAREQLGYVKDGEVIVVLPDLGEEISTSRPAVEPPTSIREPPKTQNWRLWHRLFFGQ